MERRTSIWWLGLLWIPVFALVLGLVVGCAGADPRSARAVDAPPKAELRRLVAQAMDNDSPFDTFAATHDDEAQRVAAVFRPVVSDVTARECRAAGAQNLDCTLEVILQFPAMGGRETQTTWERRLRHVQGTWQIVGVAAP